VDSLLALMFPTTRSRFENADQLGTRPHRIPGIPLLLSRPFSRIQRYPARKAASLMQTFRGFKVLAAGGMLLSLSVTTLAFEGTASALTPLSVVTCSHLKGSSATLTAALSGCSAGTGGTGWISSFTPSAGDDTWTNGTKTDYTSTATNTGTKCPSTAYEFNITGTVSSSTNSSIPTGAVVKMTVCSFSSGKLKNAAGTLVKF
jgi:hypothetical protein